MALLSNTFAPKPFAQIYNNGVPEGVIYGESADHEILQNIPDEAIDEVFPPTAADAAEMDLVDDYIRALVDISFLEDSEERARTQFSHIKKRWEARRGDGLKGKPSPQRSELEDIVQRILSSSNSQTTDIVHSDKRERLQLSLDSKLRARNKASYRHQNTKLQKRNRMPATVHSKNIQQPRKQN